MTFDEYIILRELVVESISSSGYAKQTSKYINVRCPHCGDSDKSRSRRRGFFIKETINGELTFYYKCHNGGCRYNDGQSVYLYLKEHHPIIFQKFRTSSNPNNITKNRERLDAVQRAWVQKELEEQAMKDAMEKEARKWFIPIKSDHPYCKRAISYLKYREIPERIWAKWFVAIGTWKYTERIIIPFVRANGRSRFWQARYPDDEVPDDQPKYLNRSGVREIYKVELVDKDRPVVVFEGPIDSEFCENSVALCGLSANDEALSGFKELHYLQDYDKAGLKTAKDFLNKGRSVFSWAKFFKAHGYKPRSDEKQDLCSFSTQIGKDFWTWEELSPFFIRGAMQAHNLIVR